MHMIAKASYLRELSKTEVLGQSRARRYMQVKSIFVTLCLHVLVWVHPITQIILLAIQVNLKYCQPLRHLIKSDFFLFH